jgi:Flp pilus assembly protein TadB
VPVLFGYRSGLPRFYLIAVLMVAWSIVINILPELPEMIFAVLFYGGIGVIVTLSGVFTLQRYLRTTQPVTDVQDE